MEVAFRIGGPPIATEPRSEGPPFRMQKTGSFEVIVITDDINCCVDILTCEMRLSLWSLVRWFYWFNDTVAYYGNSRALTGGKKVEAQNWAFTWTELEGASFDPWPLQNSGSLLGGS